VSNDHVNINGKIIRSGGTDTPMLGCLSGECARRHKFVRQALCGACTCTGRRGVRSARCDAAAGTRGVVSRGGRARKSMRCARRGRNRCRTVRVCQSGQAEAACALLKKKRPRPRTHNRCGRRAIFAAAALPRIRAAIYGRRERRQARRLRDDGGKQVNDENYSKQRCRARTMVRSGAQPRCAVMNSEPQQQHVDLLVYS